MKTRKEQKFVEINGQWFDEQKAYAKNLENGEFVLVEEARTQIDLEKSDLVIALNGNISKLQNQIADINKNIVDIQANIKVIEKG